MEEFIEPAYVLDYSDQVTRMRLRSAKVDIPIVVKVRVADDRQSVGREAVGTLRQDNTFHVRLTTDEGFQTFDLIYADAVDLTYNRD